MGVVVVVMVVVVMGVVVVVMGVAESLVSVSGMAWDGALAPVLEEAEGATVVAVVGAAAEGRTPHMALAGKRSSSNLGSLCLLHTHTDPGRNWFSGP